MVNVILAGIFNDNVITHFWQYIITDVFSFIQNYGLRVILITVALKLLLSPIDFFTRLTNLKNAKKLEMMKPELEKLQKQFADNPTELQRRRSALNKKYGYNAFGACLPLLVTAFVFITLFGGFQDTAKALNIKTYDNLSQTFAGYYSVANAVTEDNDTDRVRFVENANDANEEWINYQIGLLKKDPENKDKTDEELIVLLAQTAELLPNAVAKGKPFDESNILKGEPLYKQFLQVSKYIAQKKVADQYYEEEMESFIWIKNIWRPDTWDKPVYDFAAFKAMTGRGDPSGTGYDSARWGYQDVMGRVIADNTGVWNGWLILVVLAVGLNVLNQYIMRRQQNLNQDPTQAAAMGSANMMMIMIPVMIGFFAISQSSAFTLYMVTNALMTLIINFASTGILKLAHID